MALPKHSPYAKYFSNEIVRIKERGLFKKWEQKYGYVTAGDNILGVSKSIGSAEPMELKYIAGLFLFLG